MGLFRKRPAAPPPAAAESLQQQIASAGQPSLFAHSDFVKQVTCPACGAPKRLPSKTACLYGAPLSFPVGSSGIECPYCHSGTHRL
jgi:LSD1 subclass zinc finger protein